LTQFTQNLLKWYDEFGRSDLPWRNVSDPYLIWVSEVILQQTQVIQGWGYYLRFIQAFPTFHHLAEATEDDVLRLWQGLGYYSRARNMHAAAQMIANKGSFPQTYEEILSLKGVGEYTAAAICSFAYNLPYAVLDGNVYRVLSRYFGINTPIDTHAGKSEFKQLAQVLLDKRQPAKYNSAIMDFGAMQCKPKSLNCNICPMLDSCHAYQNGAIDKLPVKNKKILIKERYFTYIVILVNDKIYLRKRPSGDIWQGLYEPLLIETEKKVTDKDIITSLQKIFANSAISISKLAKNISHHLTHQHLNIDFYIITPNILPEHITTDFAPIEINRLGDYGMPQVVKNILSKNLS
jgi:A/G-specific adenine glycosylase